MRAPFCCFCGLSQAQGLLADKSYGSVWCRRAHCQPRHYPLHRAIGQSQGSVADDKQPYRLRKIANLFGSSRVGGGLPPATTDARRAYLSAISIALTCCFRLWPISPGLGDLRHVGADYQRWCGTSSLRTMKKGGEYELPSSMRFGFGLLGFRIRNQRQPQRGRRRCRAC